MVGSAFAIAIGKHAFGGLGQNIFNPALIGRVFLLSSWPKYMTTFTAPFQYDVVTSATPLALLKEGKYSNVISYFDLFIGSRGGCIGEVCIIALLARGNIVQELEATLQPTPDFNNFDIIFNINASGPGQEE